MFSTSILYAYITSFICIARQHDGGVYVLVISKQCSTQRARGMQDMALRTDRLARVKTTRGWASTPQIATECC